MNIIMSVINGQKTASDLPVFEKRYPATGEVIAHIQPATPQMLDEAVRHAQAAQREWAHMAAHDRARILGRIAGALHQHNEELSALEVQDVGKVYAEAVSADVPSGAEAFEFFASLCATYHGTSHRWPDAIGYTQRVPLGVCAGIGAWNYPVQVACWKAAPALAAGCAFVGRPAAETPLSATALAV
ncbi:MAG: aldehyde dehydrogenase family protein, partial [Candidatus Puniceispirillaceae bacterium]